MIYKKISAEIRMRINSENYEIGDALPSEKALAYEFNVSPMTIRKALAPLEEENLIIKKHGSGSYVARKISYHGGELDGFNHQMEIVGVTDYTNQVVDFHIINAPLSIAHQLKIEANEKIYFVKRIRLIKNTPILLENSYIPVKAFPYLSIGHLEKSKFNYFKNECNVTVIESHRSYTPVFATKEHAVLLNVEPDSLLLRVQSISFSQENKIVDVSDTYQNTEKYIVKHSVKR
ncbi:MULTISPECIES: GntR family transcriptional regulator [unclassified Brenneria]|uniref:GntR family transcriptional regulator n=1 Tax=unclassified Brenneria TaxID=2634434 RepID=UPI001555F4B9|nr:GntR family transcriptional regulator [Brenneria sp. L3-3C-1]MEE3643461.1 GntR family transcriptional regulator [Brenneria sp. L3_3C_1]MEE3651645.1 GntR family transcriptional regulator [Brenneria sp. HEZEL_4_2_4]NPD01602.1 GntR family transcriptional regulator [Brenneria sp. hezel4-2-4]